MSPFVVIVITVIFIIFCRIVNRLYQFLKFCVVVNRLPGPVRYPLPTLAFVYAKIKPEDRFQWFHDILKKSENGIMMFPTHFDQVSVYLYKIKHLEVILSSKENITKSFVYDSLDPWLGKGLLTSSGQTWFRQRKIITPAFHFGVVDQFFETMSGKASVLNEIIEEKVKNNPGEPIEFFQLAIRCALDIICETAMGVNIDAQRNYKTDYIIALDKASEISIKRMHYPWLKWDSIFYRTKLGSEFKSAIDIINNFTMQIIKKKQQVRKVESNADCFSKRNEEETETGNRKKKAFLDLLLDLNENEKIPMTATELREQVNTFIFAGHDTTAAALSWSIFNLGNNPEIQDKVHEELDEVFGNSKEPATMKQIMELKYLDRVIKENLRLNPSVPGVGRRLTEDIKLDGYLIPKGCNIGLSIFNLHRDPEVWNDPLKFDPDRFLPENFRGRHPYAYIPFSAGLRNCIGRKFALVEEKIVLTALLRKWRVKSKKSQEEIKLYDNIVLKPHNGNLIYFTLKS